MKPRFTTTVSYGNDAKEAWQFEGMGAEKRAFSLMNSITRRKTEFVSASVSHTRHDGTEEVLAITSRINTQEGN